MLVDIPANVARQLEQVSRDVESLNEAAERAAKAHRDALAELAAAGRAADAARDDILDAEAEVSEATQDVRNAAESGDDEGRAVPCVPPFV